MPQSQTLRRSVVLTSLPLTDLQVDPDQVSWLSQAGVRARASDAGGSAVSAATARVDSGAPGAMSAEEGFGRAVVTITYGVNPWGLSLGQHVLSARAQDALGNPGEPVTATFVVTNPLPTVASAFPIRGWHLVTTTIVITGSGFLTTPLVFLGDSPASNVTLIDSAHVRATVPAGLSRRGYDLRVENPDGQSATLPNGFTVFGEGVYLPAVLKGYGGS